MSATTPQREPIRVLPAAVAQRIAAGEVVQRPTSVLRELLENALDAGADAVEIEWRGAGLELIRVSDDGAGIAAADLELAFARHGTSKVRDLADLQHVTTLGFRGEALPSIAAVAHVELTTAQDERDAGARIEVQAGVLLQQGRVARTKGTTVTVRGLFADLPVRRGFLPSARTETALALALVRRYALAWPHVRFQLKVDGRQALRAAGLGEASALACAFGAAAQRLHALPPLQAGPARIRGMIGDPGLTRADREALILIVNRRWVQPQRWLTALDTAYQTLLPRGRHPVVVLYVEIDPALVEVNLHPAKLEIRVVDEDQILLSLSTAIKQALGRLPAAQQFLKPTISVPRQDRLRPVRRTLAEEHGSYHHEVPSYARLRLIGQVQQRTILVEDAGALYLIDQHRADERALYERLTRRGTVLGAQELLAPLHLELRAEQQASVEAALPALAALGFRCERFGQRTFLVRSVPAGFPSEAAAALGEAIESAVLTAPDWQERICATVACRAAVRRGVVLTTAQMESLLRALDQCEVQTICPHGSPIVAQVSLQDLARHFSWT